MIVRYTIVFAANSIIVGGQVSRGGRNFFHEKKVQTIELHTVPEKQIWWENSRREFQWLESNECQN